MNEKDYGILYEFLKPGIEKMYQYLYVSENNVENYTDAVNAFDVFSKRNPKFINGGVCDASQMCINGNLNTFISNSVKGEIK